MWHAPGDLDLRVRYHISWVSMVGFYGVHFPHEGLEEGTVPSWHTPLFPPPLVGPSQGCCPSPGALVLGAAYPLSVPWGLHKLGKGVLSDAHRGPTG